MREIGYALSGCTQSRLAFVVMETCKAVVGGYYFLKHPMKQDLDVLVRTYQVRPYNPEMVTGRTGPLAGKKGRPARHGKRLEYDVAFGEILGYYDEHGRWRKLEVAPASWDLVFLPDEEELKRFFMAEGAEDIHLLKIGHARGLSGLPVYVNLNGIAKGHLFVAGMTRSGKSTFVLNLILRSQGLTPKPHFLILDRRGEYGPVLKNYGAPVLPYHCFSPPPNELAPSTVSSRLGAKKGNEAKIIEGAFIQLQKSRETINAEVLKERVERVAPRIASRGVDRYVDRIGWLIDTKGGFLKKGEEYREVIQLVRENPVIVVDYTIDTDAEAQQTATRHILEKVVSHAMERKDLGDFSLILAIEEAQYFAPEYGVAPVIGDPRKVGVDKALVEAVSQAGGYNVGFILMSQRPAYVRKAILSQTNTVITFRLMSGADQAAIADYTEYGGPHLGEYLAGLADLEGMLWGISSLTPFPVIAEVDVEEYPRKAAVTAKTAWERMNTQRFET